MATKAGQEHHSNLSRKIWQKITMIEGSAAARSK